MNALLLSMVLLAAPKVGQVAPDFTAVDSDGNKQQLSELVKRGPVILAFFPKAFTSGCTKEMRNYAARHPELQKASAQLLAISTDGREQMAKFKADLKAGYPFIPDPDGKLVKLYDVKMAVVNVASRTTFVIDQDQKIVAVQTGSDAIDPTEAITACSKKK
jgi:thioredoxin-dependent peroxiredoxin